MVFKKKEPVVEEEPVEEEVESSAEVLAEEPADPSVVGYPIFLTQADVNKMIYENNQMLRLVVEAIQKE